MGKWWKDIIKYNPITVATDLVTGGGVSDVLGLGDPAHTQVTEAVESIGESATDVYHDISGQTAAEGAEEASKIQTEALMAQLEYLKEINKLPQELKEQALSKLGALYGLEGTNKMQIHQQEQIDQAKASPLYQSLIGSRQAGEEALMRQAAATGGLRSGDIQSALYDYNTQLERDALTQAYGQQLGGLQGLSGLGTGTSEIGQVMGNIGQSQAAGILGAAQAQQAGMSNLINLGLGIGGIWAGI